MAFIILLPHPQIFSVFIPGSDVVDWLYNHVEGFTDRREARKYASNLLKAGYIRHTVNKITFSEQCYYIFGDLCGSMYHTPTSLFMCTTSISITVLSCGYSLSHTKT